MQKLIDRIEAVGFQCEAGPLTMHQGWLLLKAELVLEGLLPAEEQQPQTPAWKEYSRELPKRNTLETQILDSEEEEPVEINEQDEFYDQAVAIVREIQMASISALQRRLRIGYNRSWRIMEAMEKNGVIIPTGQGKWALTQQQP